jgi:Uma2 family endonuclease
MVSMSEKSYRQVALEDPNGQWELHDGALVRKPNMSFEHNYILRRLDRQLGRQLDEREFDVRANLGRVRLPSASYYIPDVYVVPTMLVQQERRRRPRALEVYDAPLPLVVEVWSPSTGEYDVESKLPEYRRRGDLEIWRIHPFDHTLTAWRRQPDGTYTEEVYRAGKVRPVALSGVTIDLDMLFE